MNVTPIRKWWLYQVIDRCKSDELLEPLQHKRAISSQASNELLRKVQRLGGLGSALCNTPLASDNLIKQVDDIVCSIRMVNLWDKRTFLQIWHRYKQLRLLLLLLLSVDKQSRFIEPNGKMGEDFGSLLFYGIINSNAVKSMKPKCTRNCCTQNFQQKV